MEPQDIYLVIDDYTPDEGSTIYGIYTTRELAQERINQLSDPDKNEYGKDMNEDDTLEIRHEYLYNKVKD